MSVEAVMRVEKWGNSLAIRLPAFIVEALELKEGDAIEIRIVGRREPGVSRQLGKPDRRGLKLHKSDREELLRRLRVFRGKLPAEFTFDRDDANAR
jgi:antitoxin MazE